MKKRQIFLQQSYLSHISGLHYCKIQGALGRKGRGGKIWRVMGEALYLQNRIMENKNKNEKALIKIEEMTYIS